MYSHVRLKGKRIIFPVTLTKRIIFPATLEAPAIPICGCRLTSNRNQSTRPILGGVDSWIQACSTRRATCCDDLANTMAALNRSEYTSLADITFALHDWA